MQLQQRKMKQRTAAAGAVLQGGCMQQGLDQAAAAADVWRSFSCGSITPHQYVVPGGVGGPQPMGSCSATVSSAAAGVPRTMLGLRSGFASGTVPARGPQ
jgi:hypothetical protein